MASKQRRNRDRKVESRSHSTRTGSRLGPKTYGLIMGLVALLVIVGAGVTILGPGRSSNPNPPQTPPVQATEISLDKSKGPEDAAVVVVEYGDFQ